MGVARRQGEGKMKKARRGGERELTHTHTVKSISCASLYHLNPFRHTHRERERETQGTHPQ
jgi:hypothetical protein